MNLTGRGVYIKGEKKPKRSRPATPKEREAWGRIAATGCIIANCDCRGRTTIHHCFTGRGGRKNHKKVLPLCVRHHLGDLGINGGKISRRKWESMFGTEAELIEKLKTKMKGKIYDDE